MLAASRGIVGRKMPIGQPAIDARGYDLVQRRYLMACADITGIDGIIVKAFLSERAVFIAD